MVQAYCKVIHQNTFLWSSLLSYPGSITILHSICSSLGRLQKSLFRLDWSGYTCKFNLFVKFHIRAQCNFLLDKNVNFKACLLNWTGEFHVLIRPFLFLFTFEKWGWAEVNFTSCIWGKNNYLEKAQSILEVKSGMDLKN